MSNARTPKTLDTTQQLLLLNALLRTDSPPKTFRKGIRNHLIACLMLDAGLRVGEVVSLQFSDLFFAGQYVKVLVVRPEIAKNHKERTVPVSARLATAIEKFGQAYPHLFIELGSNFVFTTSESGKQITTRQVENIMNTASSKAFGWRINPHMLRHTFGSNVNRVAGLRVAQELLGHSYVTSTQIYTHPNADDKKKAIEDLEQQTKSLGQDLEDLAGLGP